MKTSIKLLSVIVLLFLLSCSKDENNQKILSQQKYLFEGKFFTIHSYELDGKIYICDESKADAAYLKNNIPADAKFLDIPFQNDYTIIFKTDAEYEHYMNKSFPSRESSFIKSAGFDANIKFYFLPDFQSYLFNALNSNNSPLPYNLGNGFYGYNNLTCFNANDKICSMRIQNCSSQYIEVQLFSEFNDTGYSWAICLRGAVNGNCGDSDFEPNLSRQCRNFMTKYFYGNLFDPLGWAWKTSSVKWIFFN